MHRTNVSKHRITLEKGLTSVKVGRRVSDASLPPEMTSFLWHSAFAWNDVGSGPFGPSSMVHTKLMAPGTAVADPVSRPVRTFAEGQ